MQVSHAYVAKRKALVNSWDCQPLSAYAQIHPAMNPLADPSPKVQKRPERSSARNSSPWMNFSGVLRCAPWQRKPGLLSSHNRPERFWRRVARERMQSGSPDKSLPIDQPALETRVIA